MTLIVLLSQLFLVQWLVWHILTSVILTSLDTFLIGLGIFKTFVIWIFKVIIIYIQINFHWMSNLSSIQYLDFSDSKLLIEVGWLQIMSVFPSLSALYASNCELVNLNPPLGFVNFTSLQYLYLSDNLFSHEIPNWFSNLTTSLLHLDLSNNSLRGEIPPSIFNSPKLESLYLDSNKLIGKIPESLGQLKHLTYLNMRGNSFSGPIPSSIGNLSSLVGLYLSYNQLEGAIPKTLGLLSNLSNLYVANNFLTDRKSVV